MKIPLKPYSMRLTEAEVKRLEYNANRIDSNLNEEVRRAIIDRNKKLERKFKR